jgi:hypothetical protein
VKSIGDTNPLLKAAFDREKAQKSYISEAECEDENDSEVGKKGEDKLPLDISNAIKQSS